MINERNPRGKSIRFISSHYDDLFKIPDGSCIKIDFSDGSKIETCTFLDEYHTRIGQNVYHICEFAEIMERNGAKYQPEPEIFSEEMAWQIGSKKVLALQLCDSGYDFTLYDTDYTEIDGGRLENDTLSMTQARNEILASFNLFHNVLYPLPFEEVVEKAEQHDTPKPSVIQKLANATIESHSLKTSDVINHSLPER